MSQRDFSEMELSVEDTSSCSSSNNPARQLFVEKVRESNSACQKGDFPRAVALYTEALALEPANAVLYSNRSAALLKLGQFARALQDAIRARDINPKWPKAYYRQGVALQCLGRHADALAAFSSGLAQDSTNQQLLAGLVEAAMKSPLRGTLEPTYRQLQMMRLDKSPFVLVSVVGQELLAAQHAAAAVVVLESALKVGTCSLKLRGSVFSALSSAYWALNSLDKAISYMQQDLAVAKSLADIAGECRAHGNLGSAYFSKGNYKEALTSHRYQLVLAMKCKDTHAAATALTSLGHVYTAIGDYPNALASHKQCVQLVKQIGDRLQEAREIGNVGAVYLAMGDFDSAVDCHTEHLRLSKQLGNKVEEARAYSNLGSSHHYKRNFDQAIAFHDHVLRLAHQLGDRTIEARAYAGLGHAARCMADYAQAKRWHECQLDVALSTKDRVGEGRALSNLGIVYQLLGDHDAALKLHQAHLNIARSLDDRAGMGRAYGNIGNAYSTKGNYEQAIKYHKQELTISKEVNDRSSEASTHGNLAVAYQALGMHEMALLHYHGHLNIGRELKDTAGEACALLNLANCHSSAGEFAQAVPFYENYLMLSQELHDVEGEAKACHFLGYAHYCLGNYKEAIRYYDQDLALAKDLQDKTSMARAYCNLGLAHLALGNYDMALECQKYFLALSHSMRHLVSKLRALGNIGDVLVKMQKAEEASRVYQKQLALAKQSGEKNYEASAYGALGLSQRLLKCYDKALGFHTQELTLRQESGEAKGECRAHGNLGAVHMSLANYSHAIKCYEEQLERARELRDNLVEAQALGNLGIARLNMSHFEDAIGYFEQQLATLEQLTPSNKILLDKGQAYGNLGDCYDSINDYDEAVKCHEQYLAYALQVHSVRDQEKAYRGLGNAHKNLGDLQQALVCFEKRLVVCHELNNPAAKGSAYGELGQVHRLLHNFEQSLSCLQHQLAIAREEGDRISEGDAASGLGQVSQQMGECVRALQYHQLDLQIAEEACLVVSQGRAYGNIGAAYEAMGDLEQALVFHEQHLSLAAELNDRRAKTLAYSSLGHIHEELGHSSQAVAYLQQGLQLAEQLGLREEEAKIRHRLGLALWNRGDADGAQIQLDKATRLLESLRREARGPPDLRLSLFDLQTTAYQVLQRVLVSVNNTEEALVVAERSRTRAHVDLILERSNRNRLEDPSSLLSVDQLLETVNRQKASVLYYSIAANYLHAWLIRPHKGIVKFHQVPIGDEEASDEKRPAETSGTCSAARLSRPTLLDRQIHNMREALGIEVPGNARNGDAEHNREDDGTDPWSNHLEELGDRINQDGDRSGFLRLVNRNHLFNSSSYSLSSMFSVGSVSASVASGSTSRAGSTRMYKPAWQGPSCLRALYDMLVAPFEEHLPEEHGCDATQLILVLESNLFLVPFSVLRKDTSTDYLSEKFDIISVPSLTFVRSSLRSRSLHARTVRENTTALVVGNPKLPAAVMEQWGWTDLPQAQQEAGTVAEVLQSKSLTGAAATKDAILQQMGQVECIHLATHISWKLSAIVLSPPGEFVESNRTKSSTTDEEHSEASSTLDLPALSEFLLTAADVLHVRLNARLVVVSSCYTKDQHGSPHADGVVGLTRALLAAGAQCVLVALWPMPETAVKIFFRTFYSSLLQGSHVSRATTEAMQTVQNTKHFAHPANWAGFLLLGGDVRLSNKVALMGQALGELLKSPDRCRDALRVTLHLVEKSLQRIHRGHRNAMYTTQKSIENKVGPTANGWKDLLVSVGFRFEPSANGIPASVFFPQSDPGERLTQCSASLQALLGLSSNSLHAMSKLLSSPPEVSDDIIELVRQVVVRFGSECTSSAASTCSTSEAIDLQVDVKLWRTPGCHELLASLGFDLMDVGRDEVVLRTGKLASRRNIQFALQALLALFDTQEAPRSLSIDSCSSMESLDSLEDDYYPPLGQNIKRKSGHHRQSSVPPAPVMPSTTSQTATPLGVLIPPPPIPTPRLMKPLVLGGAFASYVRSRGEPDGHGGSDAGTKSVTRDESDVAFTPSPVDTLPRLRGHPVGTYNSKMNIVKQSANSRPDSSTSSTSSATDWENGQGTVRRQPPNAASNVQTSFAQKVSVPSSADADFNKFSTSTMKSKPSEQTFDRLSVRTEVGKICSIVSRKEPGYDCDESSKPAQNAATASDAKLSEPSADVAPQRSIREHIIATQMSRLNRELPITDIYHERNLGLGLAPPLSQLLMDGTTANESVESPPKEYEAVDASFDALSDVSQLTKSSTGGTKAWMSSPRRNGSVGDTEANKRDDGDGRSTTDSQYSSYSCNTNRLSNGTLGEEMTSYFDRVLGNSSEKESTPKGIGKRLLLKHHPLAWAKAKSSASKPV